VRVVAARVGAMARAMAAAGEVRAAEPVVRPLVQLEGPPVVRPLLQLEGSAVEAERAAAAAVEGVVREVREKAAEALEVAR
jgi:hypothetical protein